MSLFENNDEMNVADAVIGDTSINTVNDNNIEEVLKRRRSLRRSIIIVAALSIIATLLMFYIVTVFCEAADSPQGYYVDKAANRQYRLEHNIFTGRINIYSNGGSNAFLYKGRMRLLSNVIRITDGLGKNHIGVFVENKIYFVNRNIVWSLSE